jgi:putative phage-type endonuclease
MSYSVKNYIKQNLLNNDYAIDDLDNLTKLISKDSNKLVKKKAIKKILCRYVHVKNSKIYFDIQNRKSDQTLENIQNILEKSTTNNYDSDTNNSKVSNKINKKTKSKKKKKSGFGSLKKSDINNYDSDVDNTVNNKIVNNNTVNNKKEKTEKSKKKKKGGFGFIKKSDINNYDSDVDNTVNDKIEKTKKAEKSKKKKKGGFGFIKKSKSNINNSDSDSDNNNVKSKQSKKTSKTKSKKKKGGFGFLKKSSVDDIDSDIEDMKIRMKIDYNYPEEDKFDGIFKRDELYGPYGSDNYHDDTVFDDELDEDEERRVRIFKHLDSIEYPAQRSKEWFDLRNGMITASDGGTVVGLNPYEKPFEFVNKKVYGKPFNTSIHCYHGKKLEEIATMVYEYRMNVKVKEFGLCQHPKHKFLGASPDGIVCETKLNDPTKKTKYVGRMLEIKCPFQRKILMDPDAPEVYGPHGEKITNLYKDVKKGVCPAYYWVQVQLQLQCCELDECDFWQAEISEYDTKEEFLADTDKKTPWLSKRSKQEKGCLIQLMPINIIGNEKMSSTEKVYNHAQFIYPPRIDMTPHEMDKWVMETLNNLNTVQDGMFRGTVFHSMKYWRIDRTRNITIDRDDKWFEDNLEKFRNSWDRVKYFRANKDKAKLFKRYQESLPKYQSGYSKGKVLERCSDELVETMNKIYNEPTEDDKDSHHKKYAKFLSKVEKNIIDKIGHDTSKEDKLKDMGEKIDDIKDVLNIDIPDDLDEDMMNEEISKLSTMIETVKEITDKYMLD